MASIRKHRNKWQAQVRLQGIKPLAKSFDKKGDALAWARVIESRVTLGTYVDPRLADSTLLSEVIDRYLEQLVTQNRVDGAVVSRLKRLRSDLGAFSLSKLGAHELSEYRDRRLLVANPATVVHELSLLRRMLRLASTEWAIPFPQGIPHVRLPKLPKGRIRRLVEGEESKLLAACAREPILTNIILLAIETAMRRSELIAMKWSEIDWKVGSLSIPKTKTGIPRTIPLSDRAMVILQKIPRTSERVINLSAAAASQRFSRACRVAGITNLRLHDLRHEGISRLFELGFNQMEVAAISGHQTVSMLKRYTHLDTNFLIAKLNSLRAEYPLNSRANLGGYFS